MRRTYTRLTGLKRTYEIEIQLDNQRCIVRFEGEYKGQVLPPPIAIRHSAEELFDVACASIRDLVGVDE